MRTLHRSTMLAVGSLLALANLVFIGLGVAYGTSPALWVLNAVCGGCAALMTFVIWDDTRY